MGRQSNECNKHKLKFSYELLSISLVNKVFTASYTFNIFNEGKYPITNVQITDKLSSPNNIFLSSQGKVSYDVNPFVGVDGLLTFPVSNFVIPANGVYSFTFTLTATVSPGSTIDIIQSLDFHYNQKCRRHSCAKIVNSAHEIDCDKIPLIIDPVLGVNIAQPGNYFLPASFTASPALTTVITISSSDVSIDLCGNSLTGAGTDQISGQTCFLIPVINNLTIYNGRITGFQRGFRTTTVPLPAMRRNFHFYDLNISGMIGVGSGSTAASIDFFQVDGFTLTRVKADNNTHNTGFVFGILGQYISNLKVSDSSFSNNTGLSVNGARFQGGNPGLVNRNHEWINCKFNNGRNIENPDPNVGPVCNGLAYEIAGPDFFTENIIIRNCEFNNNVGFGTQLGLQTNYCRNVLIENSFCCGNGSIGTASNETGQDGKAQGYKAKRGENITLKNVVSSGNYSSGPFRSKAAAQGFWFSRTVNAFVSNCVAQGNYVDRPNATVAKTANITSASWLNSTATYTTSAPHTFIKGDRVNVTGLTPSGYNVVNAYINSVATTTIRVLLLTNPGAFVSGPGVATQVTETDAQAFGFGIWTQEGQDPISSNIKYENCLAQNNRGVNVSADNKGYGFAFSDVNGVILDKCESIGNTNSGLLLNNTMSTWPVSNQARYVTVKDSTFKLNGQYGIWDNTGLPQSYIANYAESNGNDSLASGNNYNTLTANTQIAAWQLGNVPPATTPISNQSVYRNP